MFANTVRRPRLISLSRIAPELRIGQNFGDSGRLAPHKNLVVEVGNGSTTTVQASADAVELVSNAGERVIVEVGGDATITNSGQGGLDTGSEASSTVYYVWAIWGPSTPGASVLLSTQYQLASVTLPAGYTYAGLVGAVFNNSSSNFVETYQVNRRTIVKTQLVVNAGTFASITEINLSAYLPVVARYAMFEVDCNVSAGAAWDFRFYPNSAGNYVIECNGNCTVSDRGGGFVDLPLLQPSIWGLRGANNPTLDKLWLLGWRY